jgi:heat shock protein beta
MCRVTLHLKEDAQELGDPVRLSRLIKQYSQFISFPIKLYSSKKEPFKVSERTGVHGHDQDPL